MSSEDLNTGKKQDGNPITRTFKRLLGLENVDKTPPVIETPKEEPQPPKAETPQESKVEEKSKDEPKYVVKTRRHIPNPLGG